MTKVLVLYYSSYGHIEEMARAVAGGAAEAAADVTVKRVPELVPEDIAREKSFQARSTGGDREAGRTRGLRCDYTRYADTLR